MLKTRLIVGSILAVLAAGMLLLDERFAPWFPFLFATFAGLSVAGCIELIQLLPPARRPPAIVCIAGVLLLYILAWMPVIATSSLLDQRSARTDAATWVLSGFAAVVLAAFLVEMSRFRTPGGAVERIALTIWVIAYLGLLPTFLIQFRTNPPNITAEELRRGTIALALAIFVPKGCDIGAYFTGRAFGRHRMTPVLSPKKTWEGAVGGVILAIAVAFGLNQIHSVIPGGYFGVIAFGISVGVAGMLGDLAESLIKRDCETKDASQAVPGFGGILDVADAVIFAAPVSYWWLR